MRRDHVPLIVATLALAVLPFVLDLVGLPLRTAIDVVVFAVACMKLNILVGIPGSCRSVMAPGSVWAPMRRR
jgi:hypothetical protein